jgi:ketosteroid isomerase-like protein
MDTQAIAMEFVALCQAGQFAEAGERFWADDVVSIESMGPVPVSTGIAAVRAKSEWWYANHEIHSATATGPYVNGDQFAVRFSIDVTMRASGQRMAMEEVGLYTLRDGKIVEERFFFGLG